MNETAAFATHCGVLVLRRLLLAGEDFCFALEKAREEYERALLALLLFEAGEYPFPAETKS